MQSTVDPNQLLSKLYVDVAIVQRAAAPIHAIEGGVSDKIVSITAAQHGAVYVPP